MREHRVYLFTTTVAAIASIALILSLLGLGADFGANVWPTAGPTRGEGTQLRMPDSPAAPLGAGAGVFSGPAGLGIVPAAGGSLVAQPATPPGAPPSLRRRNVLADERGDGPRRPARRPRPRPAAPVAPEPQAAVPPDADAASPPAPSAQAAAPPARDDDDDGRAGDPPRGDGVYSRAKNAKSPKAKPSKSKPDRGKQAVAPTASAPAPPAQPSTQSAENEAADGGDGTGGEPSAAPGSALGPSAALQLGAPERKSRAKSRGKGNGRR